MAMVVLVVVVRPMVDGRATLVVVPCTVASAFVLAPRRAKNALGATLADGGFWSPRARKRRQNACFGRTINRDLGD